MMSLTHRIIFPVGWYHMAGIALMRSGQNKRGLREHLGQQGEVAMLHGCPNYGDNQPVLLMTNGWIRMTVHPMMPGSWRSTPGGVRGIVLAITAKYCDRDHRGMRVKIIGGAHQH